MTTVPAMGAFVVLVALKDKMFPFPAETRLMPVVLFVQANVVPVTGPVNTMAAVLALLHTT